MNENKTQEEWKEYPMGYESDESDESDESGDFGDFGDFGASLYTPLKFAHLSKRKVSKREQKNMKANVDEFKKSEKYLSTILKK